MHMITAGTGRKSGFLPASGDGAPTRSRTEANNILDIYTKVLRRQPPVKSTWMRLPQFWHECLQRGFVITAGQDVQGQVRRYDVDDSVASSPVNRPVELVEFEGRIGGFSLGTFCAGSPKKAFLAFSPETKPEHLRSRGVLLMLSL